MDEEEAILRITKLLEMGGTMLATHHTCGAPLFRFKGEIICPVCSYDEIDRSTSTAFAEKDAHRPEYAPESGGDALLQRESKDPIESSILSSKTHVKKADEDVEELLLREPIESPVTPFKTLSHESKKKSEDEIKDERMLAEGALKRSILKKMRELSDSMEVEQDLGKLKSQLECIDSALKVLKSLER